MINREHKDRLFNFLFGREENKKWTLSLYNAVNHSAYTEPADIEITTMHDTLYMGMKNDTSFVIYNELNIYEQQASYNPNMPLRKLMYVGRYYDRYVTEHKLNIYGTKLIPLPVPKLVTFYNGMADKEDEVVLELMDAFRESFAGAETKPCPDPDISVRVRMININYGHNKELLDACGPLAEYSWLIDRIRANCTEMAIEEAVNKAIDEMPGNYEIRTFLIGHRAEVVGMCLTEYNEEETMQMFKEEGRAEGMELGAARKLKELVEKKLKKGKTPEVIAEELEEEPSVINGIISSIQANA